MKLVNNLLASRVKEMYGLTYARGEETLDFSALYMILKELLNFSQDPRSFSHESNNLTFDPYPATPDYQNLFPQVHPS